MKSQIMEGIRYNKQTIDFDLIPEQDGIKFQVKNNSRKLFEEYDIDGFIEIKHILETYHKLKIKQNCFKFTPKLPQHDHAQLKTAIKNVCDLFRVITIHYHKSNASQIQFLQRKINQLKSSRIVRKHEISLTQIEMNIYHHKKSEQEIEKIFTQTSEFTKEILIYEMDNYLPQHRRYPKDLARECLTAICRRLFPTIQEKAEKHSIYVDKIQPFWKESFKAENFKGKAGLMLYVDGRPEDFMKFYLTIKRYFMNNPLKLVYVDQIRSVKIEHLEDQYDKKNIQLFMINPHYLGLFAFKKQSRCIIKELRSGEFLISEKQLKGKKISEIFEMKDKFISFINEFKYDCSNIKVQKQFIRVHCEIEVRDHIIRKALEFLESIKKERKKIEEIKGKFMIANFLKHHKDTLKVPVKFERQYADSHDQEDQLYRVNLIKDSELIEDKIRDTYRIMMKSYMQWPTLKEIKEQDLYKVIKNSVKLKESTLLSRRYLLNQKISVFVKNFYSINQIEGVAIFVFSEFDQCNELLQELRENGTNITAFIQGLKQKKASRVRQFYTPSSKHFESIYSWYVNLKQRNVDRLLVDIRQLLQSLCSESIIKMVLPQKCSGLLDFMLQVLMKQLLKNVVILNQQFKIKNIMFYYSGMDVQLQGRLEQKLKMLRNSSKQLQISKINDLYVNEADIEKINEMKYYTVKYYQNQITKPLTSLNSFIFNHQINRKVNKMVPIFIPSQPFIAQHQQLVEYLIYFHDQQVYLSQYASRVVKFSRKLNQIPLLAAIANLIKNYFKSIDYLVVYGNEEATEFSKDVYFVKIQDIENWTLKRLKLENQKCLIGEGLLKFSLIENENLQYFSIETHTSEIQHLLTELYPK